MPAFEETLAVHPDSDGGPAPDANASRDVSAEPVLELRRQSEPPIELRVRRDVTNVDDTPESRRASHVPGSLRASAPPKPGARTSTAPLSGPPPSSPRAAPPMPPPELPLPLLDSAPRSVLPAEPPASVVRPPSVPRLSAFNAASVNEEMLVNALSRGSIEAGRELILQLENRTDRTHDLVNVCRRVAYLLPGDRSVLDRLYASTLADRSIVYARCVEHVLRAFDPNIASLEPPLLTEQVEQPDRVHSLLFREATAPATEALGLVWTGAQHMFRRDPSSYGVTGLERVAPTAPSPLARQFAAACRLLGMTRTPLFQRRSGEAITINVALLSPPALLLTGEVKAESSVLGYHLGAMLAATMPEHVLLYGASEAQVENVLRALVAAFGPPRATSTGLASIATLAEMLWESVPSRSQRRLRELCDDPSRIDYSEARNAARQAVRRAGLFVSGDLTVAVRETCADLGVSTWGLDAPGGLAALCSASPAVADLVRLATSQEYANARWNQLRGGGRIGSSG